MSNTQSTDQQASQPQPTQQRITKVEKEKDPKKVEAGRKLAEFSKAARQKKAQRRQVTPQESADASISDESEQPNHEDGYSVMTILTGVGVLTGLACLYYTYKQDKRIESSEVQPQQQPDAPHQNDVQSASSTQQSCAPQSGNKLRSFD